MTSARARRSGALVPAVLALAARAHGDPPYASWLRGIDTSHYQGDVAWETVRQEGGVDFACTKATEAVGYVDPTFATNWAGMRAAGIVRCAYHYAILNESAAAQAEHFVSTVEAHGGYRNSSTLQLMLDLEDAKSTIRGAPVPPAVAWAWTREFMRTLERATGRPGIIYTGAYFWRSNVGNPKDNLNAPLWLASYTHPLPVAVPDAWPGGWTFWQYSDTGAAVPGGPAAKFPGVPHTDGLDMDFFRFDRATLRRFCFP